MTPLRKKMIDDMVLRGLSERTQHRYVEAVAGLAKFYKRRPDTLGEEQVQRYLLHLRQERGLSASSTNVTLHALRFFFHKTLRREPASFQLPSAREPSKLPEILSRSEVMRRTPLAIPKTAVQKGRLKDRFHPLNQRLLTYPVENGRNA